MSTIAIAGVAVAGINVVGGSKTIDKDKLFYEYLSAIESGNYTKLVKLEFLNDDGTVAFMLDNNSKNARSSAFIQSGNLSVNFENGCRRQLDITLANVDNEYTYAVNHIWFGQQIRYSEGLALSDGTEFYLPQGVFEIESPSENITPNGNTVTYSLSDKWVNLDGTLHGNLDGDYKVTANTNIYTAIASIIRLNKYTLASDNLNPIDNTPPNFTTYYNGKTQTLVDGTVVPLVNVPYDLLVEGGGTLADIVLGLAEMLAAWIGYDATGRLVLDASQEDILDSTKPIDWEFKYPDKHLFSIQSSADATGVYNDVIVVGGEIDDCSVARGRAQNQNPASDTCINRIGLKTIRLEMSNYYSDDVCEAYAEWQLKRYAVLSNSLSISCAQMFHIRENSLVSIIDENGKSSKYLVQGFSRPVSQTGAMTLNVVSANEILSDTTVVQ